MYRPQFKHSKTELFYELIRRLYVLAVLTYLPLLLALTLLGRLRSDGGFIDLGFWLPFLLLLFATFPSFASFLSFGISLDGLLIAKTQEHPRPAIEKTYFVCVILSSVITVIAILSLFVEILSKFFIIPLVLSVAILCFLTVLRTRWKIYFTPIAERTPPYRTAKNILSASVILLSVLAFLFIPYRTIRFADGGTVMTKAIAYTVVDWNRGKNISDIIDPDDLQYADVEQSTRFYFFPHNFKSYRELWEMKH